MVWKKVNNSDAGTATKHGGNDIDKMADAFNGVDVSDPIKFNVDINTLYATTNTSGHVLKSNGTKFMSSSLDSERVGKSQASGNASTTVFNVAHGLGSNPTYAFVNCSSQTIDFTYTTDTTNIVVTFASAPASGTNNIVLYWRVVA